MTNSLHPKLKDFPGCHVINLLERTDRKKYMIDQFDKLGITNYKIHSYERIENSDVIFKASPPDILNKLPLGTTSSHLLTIKWWYENTDEEMVAIFEDDCDLTQIEKWNFTFDEYIKRHGVLWDGIQLCLMHEGWAVMLPRHRNGSDHGLQAYIIKRSYAKKLIDYYFENDNTINFRIPDIPYVIDPKVVYVVESFKLKPTIENIIYGLGWFHIHPLFNHNVIDFPSTVHNPNDKRLARVALHSYNYVKRWWENKGQHGTLDQLFDYDWCCPASTNQKFCNVFRINI